MLLTVSAYQRLAARTINQNLMTEEMVLHALHGLSGEVGEIHSLYQKTYQGHAMNMDDLKKEIGDVAWMLAELCTAYEWDMSEVLAMNIQKLRERYPDGFSADRSIHRKEYTEVVES